MINLKCRQPLRKALLSKQRGGALILIAFMIGIALTAFVIKNFNTSSIKAEQDAKTMEALGQAKEALIAWSVTYGDLPGLMPYPNRGTDGAGYGDGGADCFAGSTAFNYAFLIGMLPTKDSIDTNCISLTRKGLPEFAVVNNQVSPELIDVTGNPLWYAVSRNLVRNYESPATSPVINPSIINNPAHAWMVVRDSAGTIISDRVAIVIIAPGPPLAGQNRGNTVTSSHYLDQVTIGATTYSNRDYDQPDEDFIIGDITSGTFNDRLVYITIDELMAMLEQRAAAEARDALRRYRDASGQLPYSAPLGSVNHYSCVENSYNGLLPLSTSPQPAASCSCSSNRNCSCGFDKIDSVSFSIGLNWQNSTGSCTRSANSCTCTGAGECDLFGFVTFTCSATGNCISNFLAGTFVFSGAFHKVNTDVNTVTGSCTRDCGSTTVTCDNDGAFSGGGCSDNGLAPTMRVNMNLSSSILTTVSDFSVQNVISGMSIIGPGIQDDTVVTTVDNATTLTMSKPATISSAANITFTNRLPDWFIKNKWQDYIYYSVSRDAAPTMTLGARTGVEALLVTTGRPINAAPFAASKGSAQTRLSCDVVDYLDSIENADPDEIYELTNKPRSLDYNDQLFIVAP